MMWNRRHRKILLRTIIALIIFLTIWILKSGNSSLLPAGTFSDKNIKPMRYAFATLLCDDVMADAIKVLIYSMKKTSSLPFLVLVLPGVTQRDDMIRLGAEIHEISMLDYPFRVTAEKAAINKMCRYSKLHIWRFVEYDKIIFIDVDCLVVQSLENAFRWPEFSAVRDAGDTFNTGLFVLEPSLQTWDAMRQSYFSAPSYNQGDQGFINWYFRNLPKNALPVRYNTVCKHKSNAVWPLMKRQAKMIHYTSETKPWNFFSSSHKFWKLNFDSSLYYLWARTFREVSTRLRTDVHDMSKPMWLNSKRVTEVCERFFPTIEHNDLPNTRPLIGNKISVIFTKWRNANTLTTAIQHYRYVLEAVIHKVYISWNPSLGIPPVEISRLKYLKDGPAVEIVMHRYESVNNIWNPIVGLSTKAVFLADDEHLPDLEKLEIAFEAWKSSPLSLVGFFARYHSKQKLNDELISSIDDGTNVESRKENIDLMRDAEGETNITSSAILQTFTNSVPQNQPISIVDEQFLWVYNLTSGRRPKPYSLLSSQMIMLSSEYLFIYTCLLPERIHRFIDEQNEDGSDLAMNLMVTGMTGSRPMLVKSDFVDPESGRFAGETWALSRGQLLRDLVKLFNGGTRDPLQFNSVSVTQFNKIPFKKRSIKQWNKL